MSDLDFSYPKKNRLISKNDFKNLRDGSRFLVSGIFLIFYKKNPLLESRLGLAISKKIGKANKRNRLKRVVREYFRHIEIDGNYDILVTMNFRQINKDKLSFDDINSIAIKSLNIGFNKIEN